MANYSNLKAAIQAVINENHNNEITGADLQNVLVSMINSLVGFQFKGVATPITNPGTPDQNVFYFASQDGIYTNFGNLVVSNEAAILAYNGQWQKMPTGFASSSQIANIISILDNIINTEEIGFFIVDDDKKIGFKYDNNGLDFAKISSHAISVLKNAGLGGGGDSSIINVVESGFYIVDSSYNIGMKLNNDGIVAKNVFEIEIQ